MDQSAHYSLLKIVEDLRVLLRDSPEEVPDEVAIVMYGPLPGTCW